MPPVVMAEGVLLTTLHLQLPPVASLPGEVLMQLHLEVNRLGVVMQELPVVVEVLVTSGERHV